MKRLLPFVCALFLFSLAVGPAAANERGIASWYGGKFHGRLTANGEIFDTNKLTAAHRTLPFGTRVKVTSLNTGKSVVVRINDRGPFLHGRIIDLSQAAAMEIGMLESGTAPVTVEVLTGEETSITAAATDRASRGSDLPLPELPSPNGIGTTGSESPTPRDRPHIDPDELPRPDFSAAERYRIQLGSFSVRKNALGLKTRLEREGFLPRLEPAGDFTRVVLTGLAEKEISRILSSLERAGFSDYIVRAD
jgi:rare lipoprotein A